ncbi:CHAP domain-containing protein [Agromyces intestinalis]|uniref:CHAP domain-containing protein n=1 Tax=Agromyces intestinalis TaxID=2592652 RepID=A0A5C1YKK3_9MICO|nr:CHAP domain-containing protein [Agromyces intestinalis]QEO15332.1 CHAP domain-containing protein [Agromyces intestinalis]
MSGDDIGGPQPSRRDLRRAESSGYRAEASAPAGFTVSTPGGHPARRDLRTTPPPVPFAPQPSAAPQSAAQQPAPPLNLMPQSATAMASRVPQSGVPGSRAEARRAEASRSSRRAPVVGAATAPAPSVAAPSVAATAPAPSVAAPSVASRAETRRGDASRPPQAAPSTRSAAPVAPGASARPAASAPPAGRAATARPVAERRRRNGPARVFATVLVVPAIVGTVALPAYAFVPGTGEGGPSSFFRTTLAGAQALDVSALASEAAVSTDAYDVTTKAEIDRVAAEQEAADRAAWAASVANHAGAYYTPAQQAEGDDYPWWDQTPDDFGGGLSPLRYYFRECVDFVAWRMNRDQGVTSAPWKWDWSNLASGSAYAWADEWVSRGRQTSSEPIVGAVAWFPYNHVAYVQAVNGDGTVTIEEYNQNSDHSYHVRTIPAGSALYLYPPA